MLASRASPLSNALQLLLLEETAALIRKVKARPLRSSLVGTGLHR